MGRMTRCGLAALTCLALIASAVGARPRGSKQLPIEVRVIEGVSKTDDLIVAITTGRDEKHLATLMAGVDVTKPNEQGVTPLVAAVQLGRSDAVKLLLDAGAVETDSAELFYGQTAVFTAAAWGHLGIVRLLTEHGHDVERENVNGASAAMAAAERGHAGVLGFLIGAGADFQKADNAGVTPLYRAKKNGHKDVVALLLDAGAEELHADLPKRAWEAEPQPTGRTKTCKKAKSKQEREAQTGLAAEAEQTRAEAAAALINAAKQDEARALEKAGRKAKAKAKARARQAELAAKVQRTREAARAREAELAAEAKAREAAAAREAELAAKQAREEARGLEAARARELSADDLSDMGVAPAAALRILCAINAQRMAASKLAVNEVMDDSARHQAVLEAELKDHRARIAKLQLADVPEDLLCCISCEIMKDPSTLKAIKAGVSVDELNEILGTTDINEADERGGTLLWRNAFSGRVDAVELLLAAGADAEAATVDGQTAIFVAAYRGHADVLRVLLEASGDVDRPDAGRADAVELLLDAEGAEERDVDVAARNGRTVVHIAALNGHADVLRAMSKHGGDVDRADANGVTPQAVAAQEGHVDALRVLIDAGADVNSASEDGSTPLRVATKNGLEEVIALLVDAGAVEPVRGRCFGALMYVLAMIVLAYFNLLVYDKEGFDQLLFEVAAVESSAGIGAETDEWGIYLCGAYAVTIWREVGGVAIFMLLCFACFLLFLFDHDFSWADPIKDALRRWVSTPAYAAFRYARTKVRAFLRIRDLQAADADWDADVRRELYGRDVAGAPRRRRQKQLKPARPSTPEPQVTAATAKAAEKAAASLAAEAEAQADAAMRREAARDAAKKKKADEKRAREAAARAAAKAKADAAEQAKAEARALAAEAERAKAARKAAEARDEHAREEAAAAAAKAKAAEDARLGEGRAEEAAAEKLAREEAAAAKAKAAEDARARAEAAQEEAAARFEEETRRWRDRRGGGGALQGVGAEEIEDRDFVALVAGDLREMGVGEAAAARILAARDEKDVAEELLCPISCEVMTDPVSADDGHTYERACIEAWFAKGKRTSPATNELLESLKLRPNHVVRRMVAKYARSGPKVA
ncbi:hypothetical protein JL722_1717 [Aureococcus anophagefferens]|nr:hypothetical protein JL722_1717 [Aureococcus anophagefferens]